MKLLFYTFFFFISSTSNSQDRKGIWAELKDNLSSIFLYKSLINSDCSPDYTDAIQNKDELFLIVNDSICSRSEYTYYQIYNPQGIWLVEQYFFKNSEAINAELARIKTSTPDLKVRIEKAKIDFKSFEDEAEREKKIILKEYKDSLAVILKDIDNKLAIYAKRNLVLWNWSWTTAEYLEFPDITITIINPFKKKIKYVWFTFVAYNPVDDIVGTKTAKGIGPVEYGDRSTWTFETVFVSRVISSIKVSQIKIQFFDGSFKTIAKPIEVLKDE